MDTPLAIITYIILSAIVAILLLFTAPIILINHGFEIAWAWMSILVAWIGIETLHTDFEDEIAASRERSRSIPRLYRIAWKSLLTDHEGGGSLGFSLPIALDQCESLNRRLGNIMVHYPEEIAE